MKFQQANIPRLGRAQWRFLVTMHIMERDVEVVCAVFGFIKVRLGCASRLLICLCHNEPSVPKQVQSMYGPLNLHHYVGGWYNQILCHSQLELRLSWAVTTTSPP